MEEFEKREQVQDITENNTETPAEEIKEIIDEENQPTEEKQPKSSVLKDILEILESVVISVFVVLLLFTYIARPVTVQGRSMMPGLSDGDKLIMRTLFYTPKAGDIVIIDNTRSHTFKPGTQEIVEGQGLNKRLIKRVIALGGQTIDIDFNTGLITVDGVKLEEDYIADATSYNPQAFDYPVTVPEGYVFVMGDNRNNSTDSREGHVGFIKEEDILGEAVMRFYPFDQIELLD